MPRAGSMYANAPRGSSWGATIERWGLRLLQIIDLSEQLRRTLRMVKSMPCGPLAWVSAALTLICALGLSGTAWYVDVHPSWEKLQPLRDGMQTEMQPSLDALQAKIDARAAQQTPVMNPDGTPVVNPDTGEPVVRTGATGMEKVQLFLMRLVLWLSVFVPFSMTMMFTALELMGARFARFDVAPWQLAAWGACTWDALTDVDQVNQLMTGAWTYLVGPGYVGATFLDVVLSFNPRVWIGGLSYVICWLGALLGSTYFAELLAILAWASFFFFVWKGPVYNIGGLILGKKFKAWMNRTGGFEDASVLGGRLPPDQEYSYERSRVRPPEPSWFEDEYEEPAGRRGYRGRTDRLDTEFDEREQEMYDEEGDFGQLDAVFSSDDEDFGPPRRGGRAGAGSIDFDAIFGGGGPPSPGRGRR